MKSKTLQPIPIILACIWTVFGVSRFVAYLGLQVNALPRSIFLTVGTFRLHHFVYGDILLVIAGLLAIVFSEKIPKNLLALVYGIGLGLVLDEFPLWLGDVGQLNGYVVIIPYAPTAILLVTIILTVIQIVFVNRRNTSS